MTFYVEVVRKDETDVLHIGEFESREEAIACARRVIDAFLLREYEIGMRGEKLFTYYTNKGEYPCIFRDGDSTLNVPGFSHLQYAMARCEDICGK